MSELLDIYDENGNHIGTEDRNLVHQNGLWHKTIHCWIVRNKENILFQKRSANLLDNPNKLYTTASGHIKAGETLEQAFKREISEELGINLNDIIPIKIMEQIYKTDFMKKNNTEFHDRVFCNIFMAHCNIPLTDYNLQEEELDGIAEVNITDAINLFSNKTNEIIGNCYIKNNETNKFELKTKQLNQSDFLCTPTETLYDKYVPIFQLIKKTIEKQNTP